MFPWILCGILLISVLVLAAKIVLLKRSMDEICAEFKEHLLVDTNTLVSISSNDTHVKKLAAEINAQLRLLRKQRRQYLNGDRELKDAITNISHDLRTPLTAIFGYLDLLETEEKSERVTSYVMAIQNRAEVLKQLMEELFRYSIIVSVHEPMQLAPICVNNVLEESLVSFYAALAKHGITPQIDIAEKKIIRTLNRTALLRVFNNILNNAIKYSDSDLKVELLETGEIIFSNAAKNLDDVQVGKLFNRFFSVETARNSTGLGLSISKTLVEQMRGTITAQYHDGILSICLDFPETIV
ncbi:MAG: HAMP domain-containing histidine kinase [Lachnospiraceae bacterium]|nr:HAMP domain-containing histidine kinase [Lachnospiraceae bacterium]